MAQQLTKAGMSLLPGHLYVVVHDEWASVFSVIANLMLEAVSGGDAVWVTRRDPAAELARPGATFERLHGVAVEGALRVFMRSTHARHGMGRVLEELDHFGLRRRSLVVVDAATPFFSSVADAAALRRWTEQRGCTLVLLCPRDEGADPMETLRAVADHLAGFARVRRAGEGIWWDTFHWFGRSEFTANRSFHLEIDGEGTALLQESVAAQRESAPAADEERVLAAVEALAQGEILPVRWSLVDGFESLLDASLGAKAATVVLAFGAHTTVDQLARQVFDLRRTTGPRLKIVVREMKLRLRHNQEQLLLRLGANLVVPAELGFSRLLALVETVQGQLFTHPLPRDYTAALTDVIPLFGQGYLPPARFAEAVARTVERSRTVGIQNALVRLPLPPGLTAVDALGYCTMTRPGDICTADQESLWLFLFACRETDVDTTLGRVFEIAVKELFDDETRLLTAESVRREVDELAARASLLPDHSLELGEGRNRAPLRARAEPIAAEAVSLPSTIARAERRPLPLRGTVKKAEVA